MTRKIEVTLYQFDELNDEAKEKARDWFSQFALDHEWWKNTYDDAENIGLEITSFDLDRNRHAKGKFTDGAIVCADKIIKEHGDKCETRKTAEAFLKERDEIVDTAEKDEDGGFANEHELDEKLDHCENEFLRAILEDYSVMLQQECDYLQSDESVDENIRINEYEFTQDGRRAQS